MALLSPTGWALGEGRTLVHDHAYGARWSPNGKRLAFVSTSRFRNPSLDVANATGTGLVKLTGKWHVEGAPAWSPRGAKLAFVRLLSVSRPNETSSLWTVDPVTRIKKRLAGSAARFDINSPLAWSPGGSRLAFTRLEQPPQGPAVYRIYTVKANGGGQRYLARGERPDWSPDGKKIVFDTTTALAPPSGTQVWIVNADGASAKLLADSAAQPRFSPDGRRIVFDRGGEIWTMNADGSGQTKLTQAPEPDLAPVWSRDGSRIAFLRGASRYQLYLMNADGSGQQHLAPSTAAELDPDWSPNGTRIAFTRCTSSSLRTCGVSIAKVAR